MMQYPWHPMFHPFYPVGQVGMWWCWTVLKKPIELSCMLQLYQACKDILELKLSVNDIDL
jgi:hypothetical protein